jgi:hypothetical protein
MNLLKVWGVMLSAVEACGQAFANASTTLSMTPFLYSERRGH